MTINKKAAKTATIMTLFSTGFIAIVFGWIALTAWTMSLFGVWMIAPMLLLPITVVFWFVMYYDEVKSK